MLGSKHDDSRHVTAIVRDVVEVIAILAAGIWAIYTFVYEERIKPASEPPQVSMTGSLVRQGERSGLLEYSYNVVVHNIGHQRVYVIATGFSANGERFKTIPKPYTRVTPQNGLTEYDRDARSVSESSVYRLIQYTRYADPALKNAYELDPGDEVPYSGVFLVRAGSYDELTMFATLAFSRYERTFPVQTQILGGTVQFKPRNRDPDFETLQITLARASVW
ncbi:MAG TPA: hypothetical protein VGZ02_08685 [Candidatus Baltobacteraceae bacterium]|nr:hypothetical protein [Candidatus Baltobacteraceae bacterium]